VKVERFTPARLCYTLVHWRTFSVSESKFCSPEFDRSRLCASAILKILSEVIPRPLKREKNRKEGVGQENGREGKIEG
jgi:hypothetical protein